MIVKIILLNVSILEQPKCEGINKQSLVHLFIINLQ